MLPAQPPLSALQRYIRRKCPFLLRDLAAAADLLPHGALFSQQLLDLTHRWWTERADTDIDINDNHLLRSLRIKLHSEISRSSPNPALRPFAASPLFDRPSHSYRRSPRQAPASQPSITTLSLDGRRGYHRRVSYPGVSSLRAWHTHTGGLDSSLREAPHPVVPAVPAACAAVSALAPRARSLWCVGEWRSGHCRRLRPMSTILCGVQAQLHIGRLLLSNNGEVGSFFNSPSAEDLTTLTNVQPLVCKKSHKLSKVQLK